MILIQCSPFIDSVYRPFKHLVLLSRSAQYHLELCMYVFLNEITQHEIAVDQNFAQYTHGLIKLFIAAMAYYINTLDSQSSGRGRCGPNYFKVGDLF